MTCSKADGVVQIEQEQDRIDQGHPAEQDLSDVFIEYYPAERGAGAPLDDKQHGTLFDRVAAEVLELEREGGCGPFKSVDDWKFAQWIAGNIGHGKANVLLALNVVGMCLEDRFLLSDLSLKRRSNNPNPPITISTHCIKK